MTCCPDCRRRFTRAGYAAYIRMKETEAALRAEIAGESYDVPVRFRSPPVAAFRHLTEATKKTPYWWVS